MIITEVDVLFSRVNIRPCWAYCTPKASWKGRIILYECSFIGCSFGL